MLSPLTLVEAEIFREIQTAFSKGKRQHAISLIEHAPHNVQIAVEYIRPEKKETTVNDPQIAAIQLKAQQFVRQYMITGTVAHEFQSLINERIECGWITEDDVSETAMEYYNLFWKENSELEESEEEG